MSFQNQFAAPSGPSSPRSYRRSPVLLAGTIITALVIAGVVLLIGFAFLPGISIPMRQNRPLIVAISWSAAAVILFLLLLGVFWGGQFKVLIDGFQVTIYKAFRQVAQFDVRQANISTRVVKQSTNGIPSGTIRTLIVELNGFERRFVCRQFSRETFSELVARLNSLKLLAQAGAAPVNQPAPSYQYQLGAPQQFQRIGFSLDPSVYSSQIRRFFILAGAGAVVAVSCGVLGFLSSANSTEDFIDNGAIWFILAALIGVILFFVGMLGAASLAKTRRRTPRQITLDSHGIQLDEGYFAFGSLRRIQATPPEYGLGRVHKFSLQSAEGAKAQYLLGINQAKLTPVFPQYREFIAALHQATAPWPELLVMDLQ